MKLLARLFSRAVGSPARAVPVAARAGAERRLQHQSRHIVGRGDGHEAKGTRRPCGVAHLRDTDVLVPGADRGKGLDARAPVRT